MFRSSELCQRYDYLAYELDTALVTFTGAVEQNKSGYRFIVAMYKYSNICSMPNI